MSFRSSDSEPQGFWRARARVRALGVAAIYAGFALLWIYFSDRALAGLFAQPEDWVRWSAYKGYAFVGITSGLLLVLLRRAYGAMERSHAQLRQGRAELERRNRLNVVLSRINQASMRLSRREDLFARVGDILAESGLFPLVVIGWADGSTGRLVSVVDKGPAVDAALIERVLAAGEAADRAWRENRTIHETGLSAERAPAPDLKAVLALPLRRRERAAGTLCVYVAEVDGWGEKDVALLTAAATDIGFALDFRDREDERRRAEERARNERRFSEMMIESMPGILYFYDQSGRLLRWNRNFERISGYAAEEIAAMHPLDFFRPEERPLVAARIGEVFERGESAVEAAFLTKDGREVPFFFTGRRVEFEGQECLVGVGIDITERIRIETELLDVQARLQAVVENLREGLVILEPHGDFLHWNPAALRLLGFEDELDGRKRQQEFGRLFELCTLDGVPLAPEQWPLARVRRGEGLNAMEVRVRRRDTRWERILSYSGGQVQYAADRVLAFITLRDITARKAAERELRALNDSLEHKVVERTAALQAALARAESADRIKSAFLATMSHELRTPLNSIIGFTGIVLQELAGPLNPEQAKQLGMVRGSARHLLELINDVLDISKIESGQLEVRAEPFNLPESINRVAASVRPFAEKRGLLLEIGVDAELTEMIGDRRRVEQVLINLINNAIKFTPSGRVALHAGRMPAHRITPDRPPAPAISLRVTDTGIGIKAEDLATLFQPFRQIDTGLARMHEGTGLGLAICRRLAVLMGGEIKVTSRWGVGSEFTVVLPLQPPPPEEAG